MWRAVATCAAVDADGHTAMYAPAPGKKDAISAVASMSVDIR